MGTFLILELLVEVVKLKEQDRELKMRASLPPSVEEVAPVEEDPAVAEFDEFPAEGAPLDAEIPARKKPEKLPFERPKADSVTYFTRKTSS